MNLLFSTADSLGECGSAEPLSSSTTAHPRKTGLLQGFEHSRKIHLASSEFHELKRVRITASGRRALDVLDVKIEQPVATPLDRLGGIAPTLKIVRYVQHQLHVTRAGGIQHAVYLVRAFANAAHMMVVPERDTTRCVCRSPSTECQATRPHCAIPCKAKGSISKEHETDRQGTAAVAPSATETRCSHGQEAASRLLAGVVGGTKCRSRRQTRLKPQSAEIFAAGANTVERFLRFVVFHVIMLNAALSDCAKMRFQLIVPFPTSVCV